MLAPGRPRGMIPQPIYDCAPALTNLLLIWRWPGPGYRLEWELRYLAQCRASLEEHLA
jgi:hypothetical protein